MDFKRTETETVKNNEKRGLLARLIEIKVQKGEDIKDLMGKPMNYFDYDKIYRIIEEHEGKQQKLAIPDLETDIKVEHRPIEKKK